MFLTFSLLPAFSIRTVEIQGTQRLNPAYVTEQTRALLARRYWGFIPQHAYLYLSTERLEQNLRQRLSDIVPVQSIKATKRFPQSLLIEVTELQPSVVFQTDNGVFFLDSRGVITAEAVPAENSVYPILTETNHLLFVKGDRAVSTDVMKALPAVRESLETLNLAPITFSTPPLRCPFSTQPETSPEITEAPPIETNSNVNANTAPVPIQQAPVAQIPCDLKTVLADSTELHAKTGEGWTLLIDATHDVDETVRTLQTTLEKKLQERSSLDYVDLRYPGKVYYR